MTSVAAEIRVTGVVQGVGYRYYCYRRARQLGLAGWVRNEPDGSVRLHAEGDRGAINDLVADLKVGPATATIAGVDITWKDFSGNFTAFDIAMV